MKLFFKIFFGMMAAFIVLVAIILIVDLSNDVEYSVINKEEQPDSFRIRVETEATSEKDLRMIVKEVKKEHNDVDAVWLWIFGPGEDEKLLAKARIPFNDKGMLMVGTDSLDYIFEME